MSKIEFVALFLQRDSESLATRGEQLGVQVMGSECALLYPAFLRETEYGVGSREGEPGEGDQGKKEGEAKDT